MRHSKRAILTSEGFGRYKIAALSQADFYRAAFEYCKQEHQSGFNVIDGGRVISGQFQGINAQIVCDGSISKKLAEQYKLQPGMTSFTDGNEKQKIFHVKN